MKKQILFLIALTFSISTFASGEEINRLDRTTVKNMTPSERTLRVEKLNQRVIEISEMNMESMERSERRALRKEARYIHREIKAQGNNGIYISSGAVIIILLLIIIL